MPVIATNTAANTSLIYLNRNSAEQSRSLSKISSGTRIVRASDDAAGLAVSSRISADIATLEQASRNTLQARAVLQTADGALARVADILQRMKSLAAQSLSGSVDNNARGFINQEYRLLNDEINAIGINTEFNGQQLINGTYTPVVGTFLVGVDSGDTIAINLSAVDIDTTDNLGDNGSPFDVVIDLTSVDTSTNATQAFASVDIAIDQISSYRAEIGALISRFEYRGEYIVTAIENLTAANSSIKDVDIAAEQTKLVASQVLTEASIAALAQANSTKASLLQLLVP